MRKHLRNCWLKKEEEKRDRKGNSRREKNKKNSRLREKGKKNTRRKKKKKKKKKSWSEVCRILFSVYSMRKILPFPNSRPSARTCWILTCRIYWSRLRR